MLLRQDTEKEAPKDSAEKRRFQAESRNSSSSKDVVYSSPTKALKKTVTSNKAAGKKHLIAELEDVAAASDDLVHKARPGTNRAKRGDWRSNKFKEITGSSGKNVGHVQESMDSLKLTLDSTNIPKTTKISEP